MEREKIDNILAYLCYTLGFVAIATMIVAILYLNNKSLVYMGDALVQQYPTQFYLMKTLGSLFNEVKSFNFNIGLGQDVLFTYHYYGLTDPVNIFLGIFNSVDANLLYYCGFGIRMYIAGIAFIAMCIHFKRNKKAMVIGAFIYVFSNFCLSAGLMYPYFINTMIYMPLMIIAVDKIIKENKIFFFVLVSILSIFANVYLAYMIAILSLLYAIVSIIFEFKKNGFVNSCKIFVRGILSYIIAIAISGAIVVPIAYSFLTSIKSSGLSYNLPVFVGENDLLEYFLEMFQTPNIEKFALVGISIITLFAVISLFLNKGKVKLKVLFLLIFLLVAMPVVQSVVAGTHYGNYRWYFVEILLLSYIFVDQYENILNISSTKKIIMYFLLIVYILIISYINIEKGLSKKLEFTDIKFLESLSVTVIGIIFMLILLIKKEKLKRYLFIGFTFIALVANMGVYAYESGNSKMLVNFSELDKLIDDRALETVSNVTKDSLERVDNDNPYSLNFSDIYNYPSSSIYYGLENRNLANFNFIYRNASASPINKMHNFDGRAILDDIMSVKYYIAWNNSKAPYGFENMGFKNLYVNKNYIPFGFTYSKYIMPYEVASMNVLDRQEALLKACLIENNIEDVKHLESGVLSDLKLRKTNIDYTSNFEGHLKGSKGIDIKLEYNLPYSGELYLKLPDVDVIKGAEKISIKSNSRKSTIDLTKPSSEWYVGEKDIFINIGYFEKGKRDLEINLSEDYDFNIKDLKLECRPVENLEDETRELAKEHLKDIRLQGNGFTGNISNDGYKLMFISIPYDKAWKAIIDGVETKIYKANEGFMAVKLEPGEHTVEFRYKRPLQTTGCVISILGIKSFIVYSKKRRGKKIPKHYAKSKKLLNDEDEFYDNEE